MRNAVLVKPAATSWMSVLGGWIATIGAIALVAPAVAGILSRLGISGNDVTSAVPVIVGLFIAYLIGGYVAGRMAGYRTSWHGMLTAFFSLFVLLLVALLGYAADRGAFAASGINSLRDIIPGFTLSTDGAGNALTFAALLGFLAAILGGWVGGLLAPSHAVVPAAAPYYAPTAGPVPEHTVRGEPVGTDRRPMPREGRLVREREVVRERPSFLPSFGRKGGERSVEERERRDDDRVTERRETREEVDRR
jgi:hypothetical protein